MRRPAKLARLALLGMALVAGSARFAWADDRSLAKEHFDRALLHLKKNELEQALSELETAQRLHPHFAVLYNLGQVEAALGKPDRAVDDLERYLELGGEAVPTDRREEVKQLIAEQAKRIGRVTFRVTPDGADVEVDGREVGTSPLERPVSLAVGRHDVVARRRGYRREQRVLDVEAGARPAVSIDLSPEAPPPALLATVEIDCRVPGVTLTLDGRRQGKTPISSLAVPAGKHELVFRRTGYAPSHHAVLADPRGTAIVRCKLDALEPLPAAQSGRIVVVHADLQLIKVDGEPLRADGRVPLGRHHLEVAAVGYRPWSKELEVRAGATERVEPTLEPDADKLRAQQSQRTAAYAFGVGGIALVALAGGVYLWNDSRYRDWEGEQQNLNRDWNKPLPRSPATAKQQVENDKRFESIEAFDNITIGLAIAGAAFIGTGAVLYLTGDDPKSPSQPIVAVGPRRSVAGWSFAW